MQTAPKKIINAWAMYDWANSVYNLVITTTFFPIYFTAVARNTKNTDTIDFMGRTFLNSSLYDYTLAAAYLLVAVCYPVLASIADTRGNKKNFMRVFCYMGAIGCSMLYLFTGKENLWLGILSFMMACMGYVVSIVFYNAYLPEIAAPQDRDRISARGYSFGYIGSVIMQAIGFVLVLVFKDSDMGPRITFLLVGIWWFGFAQVTFAGLPSVTNSTAKQTSSITSGFTEIKKVYAEVKQMPVLKRFLRGFFFYSMGVQTVMLAATLFGSKLLNLEATKLIITIVIIQLVAIPGAILMSRLSAKYGNIKVLMGVVVVWVGICIAAYATASYKESGGDPEIAFYFLAVAVGLVMGGIQSLSRSTYSKLMPETKDTASYFTYYDFTEKLAIVIGIFSFGYIEELSGMKNSVLALTVFFIIGFIWLTTALSKQNKQVQVK